MYKYRLKQEKRKKMCQNGDVKRAEKNAFIVEQSTNIAFECENKYFYVLVVVI